ncbi:hypothetical protein IJG89_02350 [Candidatus Saccharibacteria bacterium]|nr:hypothetical protein [Candidatus Saccharibacteria bacterium]
MNKSKKKGQIVIPAGRKPWPHELRVASILALGGHSIVFLRESNVRTPDILLDGVAYEIKSPKSSTANSLEHLLKKALKQSPNIIIDTSRMKNVRDDSIRKFLIVQAKSRRQIKKLMMITKQGQIIDISAMI